MDDLSATSSLSIARSAFQFILHHALLSTPPQSCCGLLGSHDAYMDNIEHVTLVGNALDGQRCLSRWQAKRVACVGMFHVASDHDVDASLLQCMPDVYIKLSVSLDEKGRLDVFAYQCRAASDEKIRLDMVMIEDGQ